MEIRSLPRLEAACSELREGLSRHCRLSPGQGWADPLGKHRVVCGDACDPTAVAHLMQSERAGLAVHDPPYNFLVFESRSAGDYVAWCRAWVRLTFDSMLDDAALYVWMGADQSDWFQPLPDFMLLMRETDFRSRSFITMRNQRGYGTQKNWMAVRQELLYYTKGSPDFDVAAEYTNIPKILRGYYKEIGGRLTENLERGRSENIRAGNVWVDLQQVFYRLEENVHGCYAQKPLRAVERIIAASCRPGGLVIDWFGHSGTTLLAAERLGRRCFTMDIDPLFCEITIRRLERFRSEGRTGWQAGHPFECEEQADSRLAEILAASRKRGGVVQPTPIKREDLFSLPEQL